MTTLLAMTCSSVLAAGLTGVLASLSGLGGQPEQLAHLPTSPDEEAALRAEIGLWAGIGY